jgi:hypothetical protein
VIRRDWIIVVHLNGVPTGDVTAEVTMLGYGSNGTREIRYVVFVEDIKKNLAPNLSWRRCRFRRVSRDAPPRRWTARR